MPTHDPIANLPGGLLVRAGLADFRSGHCTRYNALLRELISFEQALDSSELPALPTSDI